MIGLTKQYKDTLCITIQHIELITSFNTIIHHWLTMILSSTHHTHRTDRANRTNSTNSTNNTDRTNRSDPSAMRSVVVNPQPRRVAVPSQVTDYFESKKPKQSIDLLLQENSWEEEPLTQQQQSVLRVIQQQGNSSAEGVSMQMILQNAAKLRMSQKDIVYRFVFVLSKAPRYINC